MESLRHFVCRFGTEESNLPNTNMATIMEAFKIGQKKDSSFYEDLGMNPYKRMDDAIMKEMRFIWI